MSPARRNQDGFTLIEMLLVVIILAILAAIVVVAIGATRGDAVHSACTTRVRSIEQSAEAVKVTTDAYPIGPVDEATVPNPLLAPAPGALLKNWPPVSDFVLRYVGTGGTSYMLEVYESDGTTLVAGCGAL